MGIDEVNDIEAIKKEYGEVVYFRITSLGLLF